MRRSLLVAFLVALVVVQPATAASYPSAKSACEQTGDGEVLVAILPGSSQLQADDPQVVTDGTLSVYPETTFRLALCKDGELKPTHGAEWSLESPPGLEVLDETDATVTVRVTGEQNPTGEQDQIDVPGLVEGKQNLQGVSLAVHHAATADSEVTEEPVTLTFESQPTASNYADNETQYLRAMSNLTDATDQLNESAAALRSGEANASAVSNETALALNQSAQSVDERAASLETNLYETAWQSSDDSRALTVLSAVQTDQRTAKTDAKNAMQNYLAASKTAERNALTSVLFNLGGAAILGLVAGAVPGWWLTERKLEDVRFDRQVNSSVNYGPRLLAQAAGLAVVALVLTLAAVVALGGLETLGGLL